MKLFAILSLSFVLTAATGPTLTYGGDSPRSTVETIIEKAGKLDNKATHKTDAAIIEGLVDFQKLTSDALGSHLKTMSSAQRAQIQELLRKIITKTVYPEAPKFFRDVSIQYTAEEKRGAVTKIGSIVTKAQKRSTVEYWLTNNDKGYRVIDFAIEGERWVENVRDQFDEVIETYGVSGLISRMKKRLKELETKKT